MQPFFMPIIESQKSGIQFFACFMYVIYLTFAPLLATITASLTDRDEWYECAAISANN